MDDTTCATVSDPTSLNGLVCISTTRNAMMSFAISRLGNDWRANIYILSELLSILLYRVLFANQAPSIN